MANVVRLEKCGCFSPTIWLVEGDTRSHILTIHVQRKNGGVDLKDLAWSIKYTNGDGASDVDVPVANSVLVNERTISFDWLIHGLVTAAPGKTIYSVEGVGETEDGEPIVWRSSPGTIFVRENHNATPSVEVEAELTELNKMIVYVNGELENVIAAGEMARDAATHPPLISKQNGNWLIWDATRSAYVDSGMTAQASGGGLPSGGTAHQMLVTDADGNTVWEDRTHYHEIINKEILSEYTYSADDQVEVLGAGELAIKTPFTLAVGEICTVNYNGQEYECSAYLIEEFMVLGNAKAMTEVLPGNNEPFIILSGNGVDMTGNGCYGLLLPLDGASNGTISIRSVAEELKKIPKMFLSEEKFGVAEEETVFLPETTVSQSDGLGLSMTAFKKIPEIGQGFIATFDGVDYECIALESTNEDYAVVFGNSSSLGGGNNRKIPFGIGIFSESSEVYAQGYMFMFTTTDSNEHTLKVHIPIGYVQRINIKYMPTSLSPVWNIVSNVYEASVNGTDIPDTAEYYSALTSNEIVDLLKTARLGGMQFFYSYVTNETSGAMRNLICPITDMRVGITASGAITVYAHATIDSSTVAYIEWRASTNNYSVEIQSTST